MYFTIAVLDGLQPVYELLEQLSEETKRELESCYEMEGFMSDLIIEEAPKNAYEFPSVYGDGHMYVYEEDTHHFLTKDDELTPIIENELKPLSIKLKKEALKILQKDFAEILEDDFSLSF